MDGCILVLQYSRMIWSVYKFLDTCQEEAVIHYNPFESVLTLSDQIRQLDNYIITKMNEFKMLFIFFMRLFLEHE